MQHKKNLQRLLANMVDLDAQQNCEIVDITNDSRKVGPGTLFLAYKGEAADGRHYIDNAIKQGAAAILYELDHHDLNPTVIPIPCIGIEKLSRRQSEIAARFYENPSEKMAVIGVTGTNGKTSCTHFIAQLLQQAGQSCAVMGTLGNGFLANLQGSQLTTEDAITVQKNLARLQEAGAGYIAMEVSSHALAQHRVAGVHFDTAIFTQLSQDHLDYHQTMENYASAKERLFQQPYLKYGVINADDEFGRYLIKQYSKKIEIFAYSLSDKNIVNAPTVIASDIQYADGLTQVNIQSPWGSGSFSTVLLGEFNVSNLLAVFTALAMKRIPFADLLKYLRRLQPVTGRLQRLGVAGQPSIVVDYSHTPDSLQKSLEVMRSHCQGKIWCVFGCGGNRDRSKRAKMAVIAENLSDYIVVTNDNPRHERPEDIIEDICRGFKKTDARVIPDRAEAIAFAVQSAKPQDMILIAGKGHETYQIIGDAVLPFSDIDEANKQLQKFWS